MSVLNRVCGVLRFLTRFILLLALGWLVPGEASAQAVLNAGISVARGNYGEAAINLASALPGIGNAIGGAKLGAAAIRTERAFVQAESAVVRTNFQAYEVLSEQTISGASRGAHRAAANRALLNQLDNSPELAGMFKQQLGTDVGAAMRLGKSSPLNPPGTVWHHPVDNPNVLQLLRQVEHTNPVLQPVLHPQGIGGFGTFYGP